jgi:hypothetical protein
LAWQQGQPTSIVFSEFFGMRVFYAKSSCSWRRASPDNKGTGRGLKAAQPLTEKKGASTAETPAKAI